LISNPAWNPWTDPWVIGIGGGLIVASAVGLWKWIFGRNKKPVEERLSVKQDASLVMTQNFQPTINVHPPSVASSTMTVQKKHLGQEETEKGEKNGLGPKLVIDFEGNEANIVHAEYMQGEKPVSMIYVRVRVENKGGAVAKGCRVYLTALKELLLGGSTIPTVMDDAKVLAWAGWNFSPIDVPPDVGSFYADVVRVSKHDRGWLFSVEKLLAHQQKLKEYVGTYRFRVTVTAENAPASSCEVDVTYNGDWHSLRAAPVANA
jgi:hypothetical protein